MKLTMIQGDTREFAFTLYEDDETTPLDLEGDPSEDAPVVTFTARKYQHSSDIVKVSDDGIELGAEDGEILVTIDPADTEDLDVPDYMARYTLLWDIQVESEGETHTRRRGTLVIYPGVTE